MNRIDQLLQQMIAETSQQVLPTVYSATMLAGLQELQSLTSSIADQRIFAAPPAAEQPDSVKVSSELLRRALQDCMFLPLEETVRRNADRNAAVRELRALLAGGAE